MIWANDHGGEGPALLLVHATGFHAHVWDPMLPMLDGFRVIAMDQRGHGLSDTPDDMSWPSVADDVLEVVDRFGLTRPFAAGHSSGGAALIHAESKRPDTFAKLVLIDPVVPPPHVREGVLGAGANPMALGARKRRRVWDSPQQMADRLASSGPLSTWRREFIDAYAVHGLRERDDGTFELRCDPETEARVYEGGMRHQAWEKLSGLGCPVLMLIGEDSALFPKGFELPQPSERVAGTHFFPFENPDATAAAVRRFLERP